jgi:hypothetical protein
VLIAVLVAIPGAFLLNGRHGDALAWLWWLVFAVCAGSIQGLVVLLVLSRMKAPLLRIHSRALQIVTFSSIAAALGILLLLAVFLGTILVGPVVYKLTNIDVHEVMTKLFVLVVACIYFLPVTGLLGGIVVGILLPRPEKGI